MSGRTEQEPEQNPEQQPEQKPKMRRSMRVLLIGSLTVNFLVAGVVIGGAVAHWHGGGERNPRDFGFNSPYTRALEMSDRRAIGKAIRKHYRASGRNRAASAAMTREVVTLLRASDLDVAALKDVVIRQNKSAGSRQETAQRVWLERLQSMSVAERVAYADRLEAVLEHRRGHGPDRKDR